MSEYRKPLPVASFESKPYWDGLREHRVLLPSCAGCGHVWFPPSLCCPECGSSPIAWRAASGRGKVFSYVVYHRAFHPGFADELPYAVALVELEEGPRLLTNILGVPPSELRCEMPVEAVFDTVADGVTLLKFRPAGG